jgi:hypothetical protein
LAGPWGPAPQSKKVYHAIYWEPAEPSPGHLAVFRIDITPDIPDTCSITLDLILWSLSPLNGTRPLNGDEIIR